MKKHLITVPVLYGSAASLLLMLLFVVMFYNGRHPMSIPVFMDIRLIILPLFMFIAMKDFRDLKNGRTLHFWQGFSIGFITFVMIGVLMSLFIMAFVLVDGDFLQFYVDERVNLLTEHRLQLAETINDQTIQDQLDKLPLTTSFDLAIDYFFKTLGIGLFLNIIISILLRKQQPNTN